MRKTNLQVFTAPSRYVQGREATYELAQEIKALGIQGPVAIISGKTAKKTLASIWEKIFKEADIAYTIVDFQGESSRQEVDRLTKLLQKEKVNAIIGAGGGKTLDTARAVAELLSTHVILCPSNASNDSPCFACSDMYNSLGEFEGTWYMQKNPLLVLVDTTLIANGSERYLAAGMADALATYIEARTCQASGATNRAGGHSTIASHYLAKACFDTILTYGLAALDAVRSQSVTSALEKVVEANILLSGVGSESSGIASAHAIHNGLASLKETKSYLHGEKVAFGVVTQLVLEGASEEFTHQILRFFVEAKLPVTLAELGLGNPSEQTLLKIASRENTETGYFKNEPFQVTDRMIIDAIRAADTLGCRYRDNLSNKIRKSA